MATYEVRAHCGQCDGTGSVITWLDAVEQGSIECPTCGGSGKMLVGEINLNDLEGKIDDIADKCNDIFEKVNE